MYRAMAVYYCTKLLYRIIVQNRCIVLPNQTAVSYRIKPLYRAVIPNRYIVPSWCYSVISCYLSKPLYRIKPYQSVISHQTVISYHRTKPRQRTIVPNRCTAPMPQTITTKNPSSLPLKDQQLYTNYAKNQGLRVTPVT